MKKVFLSLGLCAMLCAFTACGGSDKENSSSSSSEGTEMESSDFGSSDSESGVVEMGGGSSSSSYEGGSSSSSSSDYDVDGMKADAYDRAHQAVDDANAMIGDEMDKHGVAGKAAKALYNKSASDMHDALDEMEDNDD